MEYIYYGETLYHHGVKGQKWGLRKYQNEDGSLTAAGREHYGYGQARSNMQSAKAKYKADRKAYSKAFNRATGAGQYIRGLTKKGKAENERRYAELVKTANKASKSEAAYKQAKKEYKNSDEYKARQEKIKKAAIAGAAVAATALVAYGAYKVGKLKVEKANTILEGRKLCAKTIANNNRELYSQLSGYYQGKGYSDPKNAPVNRLSDLYTKSLREDMAKSQKNITEASKLYNEADKALKSSNLNKLKTAYRYAKESGVKSREDYNNLLGRANDYIERDKVLRELYKSDSKLDKYARRGKNRK